MHGRDPIVITNNFDLIRLFAALQVASVHGIQYFKVIQSDSSVFLLLNFFPGVPIFFFMSGFLISNSFNTSVNFKTYIFKRVVRIFPALWVCFAACLAAVLLVGYLNPSQISSYGFFYWAFAQLTFLQFYNPDFMRGYGTGVLNGSLWTIVVELQFYALMPLLARLMKERQLYVTMMVIFLCANYATSHPPFAYELANKIFYVTFVPWIGLFMLGHLALDQWPRIGPFVIDKFLAWLYFYLAIVIVGMCIQAYFSIDISGNRLALPVTIPLSALVLSAAFTKQELARNVLAHNDVSYGIYIYHMPIINFLLYIKHDARGLDALVTMLVFTVLFAAISWNYIEQPSLRLKSLIAT